MSWLFVAPDTTPILGSKSMVDKISMYAVAGLLIVLALFGLYHFSKVTYYKLQVATLETQVAEKDKDILKLQSSLDLTVKANADLEGAIKVQNSQVGKWVEEAEQRRQSAEKAVALAKAATETWRKKYIKLLEAPPSSPEDQCQSLEIRLDHYLTLRSES